jgi:hypothetical protein
MKKPVRLVGISSEIQTGHPMNTSQPYHCSSQHAQFPAADTQTGKHKLSNKPSPVLAMSPNEEILTH